MKSRVRVRSFSTVGYSDRVDEYDGLPNYLLSPGESLRNVRIELTIGYGDFTDAGFASQELSMRLGFPSYEIYRALEDLRRSEKETVKNPFGAEWVFEKSDDTYTISYDRPGVLVGV